MTAQAQEKVVPLDYTGKPLRLSMSDLIFLWDEGLINNQAFCVLALKLDKVGQDGTEGFDLDEFADRWEGPPRDSGKTKRLTHKDIQNCLAKLEKAGHAELEVSVQLKIRW